MSQKREGRISVPLSTVYTLRPAAYSKTLAVITWQTHSSHPSNFHCPPFINLFPTHVLFSLDLPLYPHSPTHLSSLGQLRRPFSSLHPPPMQGFPASVPRTFGAENSCALGPVLYLVGRTALSFLLFPSHLPSVSQEA